VMLMFRFAEDEEGPLDPVTSIFLKVNLQGEMPVCDAIIRSSRRQL
jgi:hypothetical protein